MIKKQTLYLKLYMDVNAQCPTSYALSFDFS